MLIAIILFALPNQKPNFSGNEFFVMLDRKKKYKMQYKFEIKQQFREDRKYRNTTGLENNASEISMECCATTWRWFCNGRWC